MVNEKLGDQVIHDVMSIGNGDRVTVGMVCETSPLPTSWCRLPPALSVPHANCLVKLTCDPRLAVARNGLTVFFSIRLVLVE